MCNILVFVNRSTAINTPVEIAAKIHEDTNADVTIASFYENTQSDFDQTIREYSVPIIPLGGTHRFDIHAYERLRKLVKKRDFDILHTHHNAIGSVARALFSYWDIAIANTEHSDHESYSLPQRLVNFPTFPLVDDMIYISNSAKSSLFWYENLFTSRCREHVIYNGVDLDKIDQARGKEGGEQATNNIVTVGRLVDVKNQETLLRAFSDVLDSIPDTTLTVVGDGPRREYLESTAEALGISDLVTFTGTIPRQEVYEILDRSDIFVIPSKNEGFCVTAIEAMACELPVVASDIETLHEVVGDVGQYASVDSPREFSTTIRNLVENPKKREQLGNEGRQRVIENFRLERTAEEYYKVYKQAVVRNE